MRAWLAILLLGLATAVPAVPAAPAAERAVVAVTTTPPGATIHLNGAPVGVAPTALALPAGEAVVRIEARHPGHQSVQERVDLAAPPDSVHLELAVKRSRIPVTVADDPEPAPDGRISLREALLYAQGARSPAGADRVLIDGPVGAGRPDDIVVAVEGLGPSPVLTVTAPLPGLDDPGDALAGPEAGAAIARADGAVVRGPGLVVGPETGVADLVLDGFDIGLEARGFGTARAERVRAIGGAIGFSATDGAELLVDGAAAAAGFAPVFAAEGGLVDGVLETILPASDTQATLRSGPAGAPGYVIAEGWLPTGGQSALYARHDAPIPLHRVAGLDARSSSYEAYRVFGVEAYEHFPVYAIDGPEGDYFQWQFLGPPETEHLVVSAARPLRTERLEVVHLEAESRLVRYRLTLLDRHERALAEYEVTADSPRDVIEVDPSIDFFGFRIDILEAEGTTPGIREIEAEVLDSDAYPPVSRSRRRVVFPRPGSGTRAAVEIAGRLVPLGEDAFADRAGFAFKQYGGPWQPETPVVLTLPQEADAAALEAALAGLDPERPAVVRLAGGIAIGPDFPPVTHPDLALEGGTLHMGDGARLRVEGRGDLRLRNLRLEGGGIVLGEQRDLEARGLAVTGFATAIEAGDHAHVVLVDSRLADGAVAVANRLGSTSLIGTTVSRVGTAVAARAGDPVVLLATRVEEAQTLFDIPAEGRRSGAMVLVGNAAAPAPALDREAFPASFAAGSLIGDNQPARLGLPGEAFHVQGRRWLGVATRDLRTGREPTHLRLVVPEEPGTRCIALSGERQPVPLPRPAALILHDTPVSLRCLSGSAGAAVPLPLAEGEGDGPVAATRLDLALGDVMAPDPAVFEAVELAMTAAPLGEGQPYPPRDADLRAERLGRITQALIEGGDYPLAFARAMREVEANPRDDAAARWLGHVARRWAEALLERGEAQEAERLLSELADAPEPPAGIEGALVGLLHDRARTRLDAGAWEDARRLYRRILARRPGEEVARGNLLHAYQKAVSERLAPESVGSTIDWVEREAGEGPQLGPEIVETAAVALNNATVAALNESRFADALALARAQHRWRPTERTLNNLQVAFQEFARDALARGTMDQALETLAALSEAFGPEAGIDRIATNVFGAEAQRAVEAGETARAVAAARALYAAAPSERSGELLAFAHARHAQALIEREGLDAAMDMLAEAVAAHPDLGILREQAAIIGNNAAIGHMDAEEYAKAVAAFERALEISPGDEGLRGNLRVAYVNWAITAANAGRLDEAREAAEAGLARFPGDADLAEVMQFVESRQ